MKPALLLMGLAIGSRANWTEPVWDEVRAASSCVACEALLRSLQKVARRGPFALETVVTNLCIRSKVYDADFCAGLVASQVPSAHYVLSQLQIPSSTAQTFCASVLDLCPPPPPRPFNLTLPPSPPPAAAAATTNTNTNTIRIAHITDTHVDLLYTPGSSTTCRKPICCRPDTPRDAPGNTAKPCPAWGHSRCDPPLRLLESMISAVHALQPHLALYTGDVVPHDIWNESQPSVLRSFNTTYTTLQTLNCPIFPAIGNHDTHPVNIFPVSDTVPAHLNPQWAYDDLAAHWRALLPDPDPDPIPIHHGAYSSTITLPNTTTTLKIISYNSNLYYRLNLLTYTTPMSPDPMNQFVWLIAELSSAEHLAQKVYLITHIPSTSKDTLPEYASYLGIIFRRFKHTIVGVFCGHGHIDTFDLIYGSAEGEAEVVELMAPAMTPTSGLSAFRIFDVDVNGWEVWDYGVWVGILPSLSLSHPHLLDIPSSSSSSSLSPFSSSRPPNNNNPDHPIWIKYYSAQDTYGRGISNPAPDTTTSITTIISPVVAAAASPATISPASPSPAFPAAAAAGDSTSNLGARFWAHLTDAMDQNHHIFQQYWMRRTRGWHVPVCVGGCVDREICRLRGGCQSKSSSSLVSMVGGRGEESGYGDGGGDWDWEGGALERWLRKVQAGY
ncbi:Metallo-dependent phosphatase [Aspergillus sclerotiicarbonarius CBS 121057]|uniref:Metallo-dependent phosphatase n=1 Tax=Aspergillus sclerotiicarbonarius (strain CBS 121057 / IBT 28362) TaxID=1448318 RepID=A0A319DSW7_ASPSB|nr:Metallo-dependent phosphatase [Aspergillus sclerotiicarbonarius CBS 121057]